MYLEKIAEDASRPQIMVDVETLGTTAGCAPIAIAAVAFNTSPGQSWLVDPRCWRINLRSAMSMGHHIDPDTLYWWVNKHPEMFQRLMRETEDTDGGLWHLGDALWDVSRFVD